MSLLGLSAYVSSSSEEDDSSDEEEASKKVSSSKKISLVNPFNEGKEAKQKMFGSPKRLTSDSPQRKLEKQHISRKIQFDCNF